MRFWKTAEDEKGSIVIFAVMTFLLMITLAGFAIDTARVELERTKIQVAIDNASLAAASLIQSVDESTGLAKTPKEVVDLYMAKADISEAFLGSYTVVQDETVLNDKSRYVSVSGTGSLSTIFMHMMGVEDLDFVVESAALARDVDTEISLVLDISGSMAGSQKLGNLVTGAKEFVTTMLEDNLVEKPNATSISLIPYSAYVNVGKDLSAVFEGDYRDFSRRLQPAIRASFNNDGMCGQFTPEAFNSTSQWNSNWFVPRMTFGYRNYGSIYAQTNNPVSTPWCPAFEWAEILPVSKDEVELHRRLDQFKATTNTSIDDGARWGTMLLDPTARDEITSLTNGGYALLPGFPSDRISYEEQDVYAENSNGDPVLIGTETVLVTSSRQDVDPVFEGRPLDYGESNKIMVLMTDGYNTDQYELRKTYSDKYSSPARATATRNGDPFYWRGQDNSLTTSDKSNADPSEGWVQLNWEELFAIRPVWNVASFSGSWRGSTFMRSYRNHNAGNSRLQNICSAAKNQGVVIYTITYEASSYSANIMRECASSGAHYVATADTISSVFGNIAQSARKLQLTQ